MKLVLTCSLFFYLHTCFLVLFLRGSLDLSAVPGVKSVSPTMAAETVFSAPTTPIMNADYDGKVVLPNDAYCGHLTKSKLHSMS